MIRIPAIGFQEYVFFKKSLPVFSISNGKTKKHVLKSQIFLTLLTARTENPRFCRHFFIKTAIKKQKNHEIEKYFCG